MATLFGQAGGVQIVTVHAHVSSNGICSGFSFKYGKFPLSPSYLTELSVPQEDRFSFVEKNKELAYTFVTALRRDNKNVEETKV